MYKINRENRLDDNIAAEFHLVDNFWIVLQFRTTTTHFNLYSLEQTRESFAEASLFSHNTF